MSDYSEKRVKSVTVSARPRTSSTDSSDGKLSLKAPSLKSPRTARFAEATAVCSPIEPGKTGRNPFLDPATPIAKHFMAQPQPSDVGFGYVNKHESVEMPNTENPDYPSTAPKSPLRSPLKSPLKSALRTPGAPPRDVGTAIFTPRFTQEEMLEKEEKFTEKQQAKDLSIKTRVRMAKMLLRGVNFSCSLIVVSMLSATFTIFNASRALPTRNSFPPWAPNQKIWPQVTLLCIAAVSLFASVIIFYAYYKGGHRRAEKAAVYYTAFAVAFFVFSIVLWGIGAGVIQGAKSNDNGQDMWGWACKDNTRKTLFQNEVDYELICRLQNWSLVCAIIEIVVETITIIVYGIVFFRFYSKRQLRKSMANRDRARSDLYLAQLRSQSAPNTPGMAPYSARDGGWQPPVDYYGKSPDIEDGTQFVDASKKQQPTSFRLQAPPIKVQGATPKMDQVGFSPIRTTTRDRTPSPPENEQRSPLMAEVPAHFQQEHVHAAPGEQVYDEVPIPGAYEAPLSPSVLPQSPMRFPR